MLSASMVFSSAFPASSSASSVAEELESQSTVAIGFRTSSTTAYPVYGAIPKHGLLVRLPLRLLRRLLLRIFN